MKPAPRSDYTIAVRRAEDELLVGYGEFVSRSYLVTLNDFVSVIVVPELPRVPWPPAFPDDWERVRSRAAALAFAFATAMVTIAPAMDDEGSAVVRFSEAPEMAHAAFWIDAGLHRDLVAELERLCAVARIARSALEGSAVRRVLDEVLPRARLDAYERRILGISSDAGAPES